MGRKKHVKKERRKTDILMWLVIAALILVFVANIPSIDDSLAFAGQKNAPMITEIMSANSGTITDELGQYCDWIEMYNPTDQPINLAGLTITDDPEIPAKYVFPYWVLDPGDYVIVYADDKSSTSTELHMPFKLNDMGEALILFNSRGREVQRISLPALETNHTYAMDMDMRVWGVTDHCTPGFPNTDEGYTFYQRTRKAYSPVIIDEVMASNIITLRDEDGDYSDWVEIYNSATEAIDLTGWGLSDSEDTPKQWEFPAAQIGPGEYLIVFLSGKNRSEPGAQLHTNFRLSAFEDTILLSNRTGQIVSNIAVQDVPEDMSYALIPGTDDWRVYSQPTPGYPNTVEGWNALRKNSNIDSPVVISEVMSNNISTLQDQYGEYPDWIELYNRSDKDVDLCGWGLTDDTGELGRWQFPSMILSPGEYLTVYASGRDSIISKKKAHTDFSLGAEGDIVVLTDPAGSVADSCCLPYLRSGLTYVRQQDGGFLFCDQPTPDAANTDGYTGIAAEPVFSLQAGMYDTPQEVELSAEPSADIYYTLDGAVPDEGSTPYTGPINVENTTAIRAVSYQDGCLSSAVACATYLIGENIDLPVVSLVTDPANLFDEQTGIYADGPGWTSKIPHYGANYWQDWERPAHVELLESDGTVGISQDIGIKIFGGYSRRNAKKSFSLMSRGEYGNSTFAYPVFSDLTYTSYKDLVLRNCGQDAYSSLIRDKLQTDLVRNVSDLDVQAHRQCIVFINGEFWGIYDLMEKINEHFIAQHHGVDPDKIDLLVKNGDVVQGSNEEYNALIEYVKTHDLTVQKYYEYVASRIDIDNFIDWCTIEVYIANDELCNIKYWKPQAPDGKWHWILYDLDFGFYYLYQEHTEYLDMFSAFLDPEGIGQTGKLDTTLIRGLLENEGFKQRFIKRFVYHCTVTFEPAKVLQRIDTLSHNIEPYVQRDMDRWRNSNVDVWEQEHLKLLRDFATERPAINLQSMQQYFGLTDAEMDRLIQEAGNE